MAKQAITTMADRVNQTRNPHFLNDGVSTSNLVFREIRSCQAIKWGIMVTKYDGSPEDAIEKAKALTRRMFSCFPNASNIMSRIGAFGENGEPKWTISSDFMNISEVGTPDAACIWGVAA